MWNSKNHIKTVVYRVDLYFYRIKITPSASIYMFAL